MPRETDKERLALLRAIFADAASNVPLFTQPAVMGGRRADEGLSGIWPHVREPQCRAEVKRAIVDWLDRGHAPNRNEKPGDAEMRIDAAIWYEFRVVVAGVRVLVQATYDDDDPRDPTIRVRSVKRDDRAWSQ